MRIDKIKNLLLVETKVLADYCANQKETVFIPRIYSKYLSTKESPLSARIVADTIDYMRQNEIIKGLGQAGEYKPQVSCRLYGYDLDKAAKSILDGLDKIKGAMENAIKKRGFVLGVCFYDFISIYHAINSACRSFCRNYPISVHYYDIDIGYKENKEHIKDKDNIENRQDKGARLEKLKTNRTLKTDGTTAFFFDQKTAELMEQKALRLLDWANGLKKARKLGNAKPIRNGKEKATAAAEPKGLDKVKFSSNLARLGLYLTDGQIEKALETNYPIYRLTKEKVAEWNARHPERPLYFNAHITRTKDRKDKRGKTIQGGKVKKIGIRLTNNICAWTSNDLEGKAIANGKVSRENFLRYDLGFEQIHYWDVNSSIPNVLAWLKSGVWENTDWHQKLAAEFGLDRATAKLETMRALFDSASEKQTVKHLIHWSEKHPQEWSNRPDYWNGKEWNAHLKSLFYGRKKYLNEYKSELFLYESAAYMLFLEKAEKEFSCKVDSCYDCFYFDRKIETAELCGLMADCFNELNKYLK